ncbi:MAG: cation:proton antiporter [Candidatus Kaelpia aquatica]|nr:cation:proton antiporter [Candidatus Kaelpia aquatica]
MLEQLGYIFSKISVAHLNVLLLLGLALFGGTVGGKLFERLKIPKVVGYIIIGVIIGRTGLKLVDIDVIQSLQPFSYFALGLIGFMVGGELKREIFQKYGKQLMYILLCEGIAPFILVTLFMGFACTIIFGNAQFAWALAILVGAIASATDPATTTNVLKEYRTRGPLSSTVLGIVALDDGLALILFVLASSVAGRLVGQESSSLLYSFIYPLYEIGGAIVLGITSGLILNKIIRHYSEAGRVLAFAIGMVLLVSGLALAANVDMLLATMTLGVVVVNSTPRKSREVFKLVEGFTPPIYVLFFVLVGARLDLRCLTLPIIILVTIYLFGTMGGKALGARLGAKISHATDSVRRYLPLALFPQAGVAIGLSILASNYFPGEIGNTLVIIITTTTFITQIVGPPLTRLALKRAGEVGLNITEEDIMLQSHADDIMDKNPPLIYESMSLVDILDVFSKSNNLYYPVVDKERRLKGIITIDNIKSSMTSTDLGPLVLAYDLMDTEVILVHPEMEMTEIKETIDMYNLDYLPVVNEEKYLLGFIERRGFDRFISTRIIELQKQTESLG